MKKLVGVVLTIALAASPVVAVAQTPSAAASSTATDVIPAKVRIVFSRFQGDKRLSTMPFEMTVRTDGTKGQLRMGTQVPVPFRSIGSSDGKNGELPPGTTYNYRDVGTNIDCSATASGDGRFKVEVFLEDVSVVANPENTGALSGIPQFRQFRSTNTLLLKDGESTQLTLATDKITGETTRIDISLAAGK
jgi:type II secretory pathway component GspD/PulD (secretin)